MAHRPSVRGFKVVLQKSVHGGFTRFTARFCTAYAVGNNKCRAFVSLHIRAAWAVYARRVFLGCFARSVAYNMIIKLKVFVLCGHCIHLFMTYLNGVNRTVGHYFSNMAFRVLHEHYCNKANQGGSCNYKEELTIAYKA